MRSISSKSFDWRDVKDVSILLNIDTLSQLSKMTKKTVLYFYSSAYIYIYLVW